MGSKRLVNIAASLCAAGLLVILLQPGTHGPLMRSAAILILAILAILYVVRARNDAASVRDVEGQLAGARRDVEDVELRARSIIDGVPDPTVIVDDQYGVTVVNKAAREVFRLDESQATPCFSALHGLDGPCDQFGRPCVIKTGESWKTIQTRRDENGTKHTVELRATPLFDDAGNVMGAIEVLHNLNEQEQLALKLQRARDDAETANRARADFVASMSHDVRTPLNAVLGMADLLRLTALTRKQKTYVQIMQSSSNMLLSLVDNMIDFASLESGNLELRNQPLRVADLLERVLEIMGYRAYSKGLELAGLTEHEADLEVSGDFDRLRQVMVNLVSNAIRFTDEGEIIVSVGVNAARDGKANLRVAVSDSGIGIPQEVLDSLFTPFRTYSDKAASEQHGSGLGLAISKQLVENMGGRIDVQSELGSGTVVSFEVPVGRAIEVAGPASDAYHALRNRRLLIVNTNTKVAATLSQLMDDYGIVCEIESRPERVSERLTASSRHDDDAYDCVVIDVDPRSNSLDLAREIRDLYDLPIILLTSIARPLMVGEVSSIGRIRAVNKPVLPSELRHNLYRLLEVDLVDPARSEAVLFETLRILIAEDNPINRKVLKGMLETLGLEADTVVDGPSVLEALEDRSYDLILMDCQMPGMDGDQVTRIIREEHDVSAGQPVVVAITADVSGDHRDRCLSAGMDDFLAKPIRLDTLRTGLRRWATMSASRSSQLPQAKVSVDNGDIVDRLQERAGVAGDAILGEFIDLFLDDTASRIGALHTALEKRDLETLRRECHALKGACLELGVAQLGECCDALGQASREQRYDDLPAALHRLSGEFDRVRPLFEAEKSRPH
jgi:signal transduction histidine kinase/CheY-like chemotaxis protein/HPt (histidine-containing phosphotransfer) domain-containing protein